MNQKTHTTAACLRLLIQFAILLAACFWSNAALAATLSVSPGTGVYNAGQTFTVRVLVNTAGAAINAAEGVLSFKPTELSVVSVSKGSIFNLWTAEPSFSNSAGTVSFSGGTPTGYTGSGGAVLSVTFRAASAGSPRVNFKSGAVLAADGKGTNVLTGMNGGSFTISAPSTSPEPETIIEYVPPANTPGAPAVRSNTHPDQALWYREKNAHLEWELPTGVTAIRTLLDAHSTSVPMKVYDTPMRSIELADLDEGIRYFHVQFKNADGWGKVTHYRLAVDTVAPTSFDIALAEGADLSSPLQTLQVKAEDATSPVRRFKVQIDGGEPLELLDEAGSSTLPLPALAPGYHTVVVEAFDAAGNSIVDSLSLTILAFDKPQFIDVPATISEGVIPVFNGQTKPHADVLVTLTRLGTNPQTTTVRSDESGGFAFIPDQKLGTGVYELTAQATDQYGAQSALSDAVRFAVQAPGLIRIGTLLVGVLSVVVPLVVLLGALVLVALYLIRRVRRLRSGVVREAHEAVAILEREFSALQSALATSSASLRASRKTNKLTKAEQELFAEMEHSLAAAKVRIVKEITDVEDVVD